MAGDTSGMPRGRQTARSTFWTRLTEAAGDHDYPTTQAALAKLAGVGQTSARKWALGGYPDLERAVRIAQKLGVCVDWLITGRGPRKPDPHAADPALARLIELWGHMDAQRREELLGAAVYMRTISNPSPAKPRNPTKA